MPTNSEVIRSKFIDICRKTLRAGAGEDSYVCLGTEDLEYELAVLVNAAQKAPAPIVMDGFLCEWMQSGLPVGFKSPRGYAYVAIMRAHPGQVVSAAERIALE